LLFSAGLPPPIAGTKIPTHPPGLNILGANVIAGTKIPQTIFGASSNAGGFLIAAGG